MDCRGVLGTTGRARASYGRLWWADAVTCHSTVCTDYNVLQRSQVPESFQRKKAAPRIGTIPLSVNCVVANLRTLVLLTSSKWPSSWSLAGRMRQGGARVTKDGTGHLLCGVTPFLIKPLNLCLARGRSILHMSYIHAHTRRREGRQGEQFNLIVTIYSIIIDITTIIIMLIITMVIIGGWLS